LVIYAAGSALTAASWSVPTLMLGWSILEGIGAALVLPALVALVAGNFAGPDRALAYGVLGGVAGAGIAVGPILGGWATTELSWRVVFAGEVVVAAVILLGARLIREPVRQGPAPRLDWIGSVLAALGLALIVVGVLQASNWGWLKPLDSPVEPFGFSLTPFVIAAGGLVLVAFRAWQRHRERAGSDPLIHFRLFEVATLRGGLSMLLAQNLILMGIFFTIPLYLQIVQGLDALETGIRMLPASVGLFVAALAGSALAARFAPRPLVRTGLAIVFLSNLMLLGVIEPDVDTGPFLAAMGVLGLGMGLIVSQLGNVVQSAVGEADRSEAGGLQYTAQQLGSSLGTALLGAVVISGLIASFSDNVAADPRVPAAAKEQVEIRLGGDVSFVAADQVRATASAAGADPQTVDAIVDGYEDAQLKSLKTALLFAAFIVLASFLATRRLPTQLLGTTASGPDPP
jgi:MFS family permease